MAEIDRVGVDDAPSGMPRFLEDQRTRLARALTPEPPQRREPPPSNPLLDFTQRLMRGEVTPSPGQHEDVAAQYDRGEIQRNRRLSLEPYSFQPPPASVVPGAGFRDALNRRERMEPTTTPSFGIDPNAGTPLTQLGGFAAKFIGDVVREGPLFGDLLGFGERGQKNKRLNEMPEGPEKVAAKRAGMFERAERFTEGGPMTTAAGGIKKVGQSFLGDLRRGGPPVVSQREQGLREAAELLNTTVDDAVLRLSPPSEGASAMRPGFLQTAEDLIRARGIGDTVQAERTIQGAASKDLAIHALQLTNSQTKRLESNIKALAGDGTTALQRTQDEVFRDIGANLSKFEVDEPVKELILANAARNYDDIAMMSFTDQRRGVLTIEEQWKKAQRIIPDMDLAETMRTPRGTAFNAETLLATQQALISKGDDVLATAGRLAENATDADKARLILEMTELNALQRVFAGGRSEAGRALRALREVVNDPTAKPRSVFERASEFIGGKEHGNKLIENLADIWTTPGLTPEARDQAVFNFLRALDKPGMTDFIFEVRRNALLSAPITLEVNAIGNTGVLAMERALVRPVQAAWEVVFAGLGRRPEGREVFFREVLPGIFGMTSGAKRGFKDAGSILKGELTGQQVSKFVETGQFVGRGEATAAILGGGRGAQAASAVVNAPTRALAATDAVFYGAAFDGELSAQAVRAAIKEGKKGRAIDVRAAQLVINPTEGMLRAATDYAKVATLKADPSPIAKALLDLRRSDNVAAKSFANIVAPFVQAPDNLIKLAGSYSPLGFIDAALMSGKASPQARTLALSRATVGSGLMYGLLLQNLQNGTIVTTAGVPKDVNERNKFYAEGKVPYAVKIGDGPWIQFSRIEPFGTPIKWVAAAREVYEKEGKTLSLSVGAQMVMAGVRATLDASYLTGLSDLMGVLDDPTENKVEAWVARTGAGFMPFSSLMRSVAYANDPFYRDPEGEIERIEAQIPGLSQNVRPVLEVTGQPAQRPESKQGLLGIVNPILVSPDRQNAVLTTLSTISQPETIGPNGEKIPGRPLLLTFPAEEIRGLGLTKSESFRLDQVAQTLSMSRLTTLFESAEFKGSVDWRKRELTEKVITDSRSQARAIVADEILSETKEPALVARAAVMKVGTITPDTAHTRIGNVAKFVRDLEKRGLMAPEVKQELDRTRRAAESLGGKPDPTVDEMLRVAPLMDKYLAIPPYGTSARPYGDPMEWNAVAEARKRMNAYIAQNPKPPGIAEWVWYSRVAKEEAALIRKYEIVGPSPERSRLLKEHPEIERYLQSSKVVG